jgi:hypothetical protein
MSKGSAHEVPKGGLIPLPRAADRAISEGAAVAAAQNDFREPLHAPRGRSEADIAHVEGVAGVVDRSKQRFQQQLSDESIAPPIRRRQGENDSRVDGAGVGIGNQPQFPISSPASASIAPSLNSTVPPQVVNSLSNSRSAEQTAIMVEGAIKQNPELEQKLTEMGKEMVHMQLQQLQKQEKISKDELENLDKLVTKYGLKIVFGDESDSENKFTKFFTTEEKMRINKVRGAKITPLSVAELSQISKSTTNIGDMIVLRDYVISKTGRENGPDIALKVIPSINDEIYLNFKEFINKNSSITEVMNVLAFLLNSNLERNQSIVKEFSIDSGTHDEKGNYINIPNTQNPTDTLLSVFNSLTKGDRPFDIATLKVYVAEKEGQQGAKLPPDTIILPAGILKRDSKDYQARPIPIQRTDIPIIISACVLQLVNIL